MTRLFTIREVDEETPVQFVGVLPLHYRANWSVPTVMFAEVDDPVYGAADELLEACKAAHNLLGSIRITVAAKNNALEVYVNLGAAIIKAKGTQ